MSLTLTDCCVIALIFLAIAKLAVWEIEETIKKNRPQPPQTKAPFDPTARTSSSDW